MSHKDILPNEEEWMREALQEATAGPRASHSVKPLGGPSSTQKRKHQITYLAQQVNMYFRSSSFLTIFLLLFYWPCKLVHWTKTIFI